MQWLKVQLAKAWQRELALKQLVKKVSTSELSKLTCKIDEFRKQEGMVRSELECWQMRNEELETQLYEEGLKTFRLKQVAAS